MLHGGGGYTWDAVYNMPIWIRKFTWKKLKEYYDKKNPPDLPPPTNQPPPNLVRPPSNSVYHTKFSKK